MSGETEGSREGSEEGEGPEGCAKCGAAGELLAAGVCGHALCHRCARRCVVEQLGLMFAAELGKMRSESPLERRLHVPPPVRCPLINCVAALPSRRTWTLLSRLTTPSASAVPCPSPLPPLSTISQRKFKVHVFCKSGLGGEDGAGGQGSVVWVKTGPRTRLAELVGQARRKMGGRRLQQSSSETAGGGGGGLRLFVAEQPGRRLGRSRSREANTSASARPNPYDPKPRPTSPTSPPTTAAQQPTDKPAAETSNPDPLFTELTQELGRNPKLRKLNLPTDTMVLDLGGAFDPRLPLDQQPPSPTP